MQTEPKTIPITSRHSPSVVDWLEQEAIARNVPRATLITTLIKEIYTSVKLVEDLISREENPLHPLTQSAMLEPGNLKG